MEAHACYNPTLERVRPENCHACGHSLVYNSTLSPKKEKEGDGRFENSYT